MEDSMQRNEIEKLKAKMHPVLEWGRQFFGKEEYDNHIKSVLEHFGYDTNRDDIKEIFLS